MKDTGIENERECDMTACIDCLYYRSIMFTHFCIENEEDVFDFRTGSMVKKVDMYAFQVVPNNIVHCADRNKGSCTGFKAISKKGKSG